MALTMRKPRLVLALVGTATIVSSGLPMAHADQGPPSSTATRTVTRTSQPTPQLTGIRTGQHASFDRVVFDLAGAAPGYRVGYVRQVKADGSGKVVETRGRANLLLRLIPTDAHDAEGHATYTGSKRFVVNYPALREVAFAGDFEATVSIALGISHKSGFRVLTLHQPTRIVVDIAH